MLDRAESTLPPETEEVLHRTLGCALEVHRILGPGYLETIYRKAMEIELCSAGLSFDAEQSVIVEYKGQQLHGQRIDLIVDRCVIVELKAVAKLEPIHQSQLVSYLTSTGLRAGLLINFNTRWLRDGVKRVVL